MRMAVVGSRTINDVGLILASMDSAREKYCQPDEAIVIISGGAKGVDTIAQDLAHTEGYDFILFKPYHMIDPSTKYSPKFFFARNKQIADNADVVVILWDGKSNGTKHIIEYCKKRKKTYMLTQV
jgi:predicted Rossmann fold nucleotide-binding protein DprA/Smf involved in DNA uptake